jgi:hypothetical protein
VHNPHKLQTHVLSRYFGHSKFASFQRQLNYFGFRKLAGKGKMVPCYYVNDTTTNELESLLLIKVCTAYSISSYQFSILLNSLCVTSAKKLETSQKSRQGRSENAMMRQRRSLVQEAPRRRSTQFWLEYCIALLATKCLILCSP